MEAAPMILGPALASYLSLALLGAELPLDVDSGVQEEDQPLYAAPTELDRIGRIVVPATINGLGPYRLVVDTGASHSAFSPTLAAALGVAVTPDKTVMLNGVTGSAKVPAITINRIQAGDYVVENALVPIVYSSIMAGADGILGVANFEKERISVDFGCDSIEISNSRRADRLFDSISVPTKRIQGGLIAVDARIGRVRAKAIIDTGAEKTLGNIALRDALLSRRRQKDLIGVAQIYGATADVNTGQAFYAPKIILGDAEITDVMVTYGDFHVFKVWNLDDKPVLLIGMDVLGVLDRLIIDYRHKKMQVISRPASTWASRRCPARKEPEKLTTEQAKPVANPEA
jgi:predicted aspartyl protease